MPGMSWVVYRLAPLEPVSGRVADTRPRDSGDVRPHALPDLTDPATLGCLLALVREAWGTRVWIRWWGEVSPSMSGRSRSKCEPVDGMGRRIIAPHEFYETEAAALVAALEAAPTIQESRAVQGAR